MLAPRCGVEGVRGAEFMQRAHRVLKALCPQPTAHAGNLFETSWYSKANKASVPFCPKPEAGPTQEI